MGGGEAASKTRLNPAGCDAPKAGRPGIEKLGPDED